MIEFVDDNTPQEFLDLMTTALSKHMIEYSDDETEDRMLDMLLSREVVGLGFECVEPNGILFNLISSISEYDGEQWVDVYEWFYVGNDIITNLEMKKYLSLALHIDHHIMQSYILELQMRSL